jgi:hypothetical protein
VCARCLQVYDLQCLRPDVDDELGPWWLKCRKVVEKPRRKGRHWHRLKLTSPNQATLLSFVYNQEVCARCLQVCDLQCLRHDVDDELGPWWLKCRKEVKKPRRKGLTLWLCSYGGSFGRSTFSIDQVALYPVQLVQAIHDKGSQWVAAGYVSPWSDVPLAAGIVSVCASAPTRSAPVAGLVWISFVLFRVFLLFFL